MKPTVDATEWVTVDGASFTDLGDGKLSASFTRPAGEQAYFRIVRQGPVPLLFEDFESGAAGWTTGTDNGLDLWELGTPVYGIDEAFSGDNVFGTDLDGAYPGAGGSSWLRSPAIDLTGQSAATLIFQEVRDSESGFDDVIINILDANSPTTVLAELSRRSGSRLQWTERAFALPAEALGKSIILEFVLFQSDEFQDIEQAGWLIDDVTVILE
jgi:bacillopeptidase F